MSLIKVTENITTNKKEGDKDIGIIQLSMACVRKEYRGSLKRKDHF